MTDIAAIIQAGAANPWLYLPLAVVLGALHALEPGHSKSMMAAFIVAVEGTPAQAALLGVSAAVGHTIVVWIIAVIGLALGDRLILQTAEPWLMLLSGLLIMGLAVRVFRLLQDGGGHHHHGEQHHDHAPGHDPHHDGHHHFDRGRSRNPHIGAHAAAHEREIKARFSAVGNGVRRRVTAFDIAWFGFTGGLLPCPAAIAVLLVCLQLKHFTLGIGMVAAFSVGLAVTLVGVGVAAAWGARAARARFSVAFEAWSHQLPYLSAGLILAVGLLMTVRGLAELALAR